MIPTTTKTATSGRMAIEIARSNAPAAATPRTGLDPATAPNPAAIAMAATSTINVVGRVLPAARRRGPAAAAAAPIDGVVMGSRSSPDRSLVAERVVHRR